MTMRVSKWVHNCEEVATREVEYSICEYLGGSTIPENYSYHAERAKQVQMSAFNENL